MANILRSKDGKLYFHPGYFILDWINSPEEDRFNSIAQFSEFTGIDLPIATSIINGNTDVTEEIAQMLSDSLGTSKGYWLNLQRQFDTGKEEIEFLESLKQNKENK